MENEKNKTKQKIKHQGRGRDMSQERLTRFIRGERGQNNMDSKVTGGYDVNPAATLTGQTVANNVLKSHKGSRFPFGHNVESPQS